MAENAWNSRDPERVAMAYTEDSDWRNRDEFFVGRDAIREFLTRKYGKNVVGRVRIVEVGKIDSRSISIRIDAIKTRSVIVEFAGGRFQ